MYLFLFSLLVGVALTRLGIVYSQKIGLVDDPGKRKIHLEPMPLLGGTALFLTIGISLIFHLLWIHWGMYFLKIILTPELADALHGVYKVSHQLLAIAIAGLIIFITGLIDDKFDLNSWIKFGLQSTVAIIVMNSGVRITLFLDNEWLSYVISYLWIVGMTNAFNFLDNMDGLCAGIALIASFFLFTISISMNEYFISGFLAVFMGAISAFLIFNFNPAKIFMGDSGSLFIGFMMACITILGTFYFNEASIFSVAMPVFILAVPIYDLCSVLIIRQIEGRPFYKGDNSHFSHRLVKLGMTAKQAVLFIYLVTFATGVSALLLASVNLAGVILLSLQCLAILSIIALLELYGQKHNHY